MGGVIKLIKNLFSGILSFIGGIFGSKKSGYFMELDEAEAAKPAATPKLEDAKSAVATVEATAKSTANAVAEGVKETTAATAAPKSVKANPAKVEPAEAEPVAIAETNGSTNGAKPVPANPLNLPQPTVSFATEHLVPKPTNSRRRPGANMGSFLEMAKTVKTPNN
ncbi:hypothetical protein [Leptolyngbya sp. FACHB-17]|uniref:hypothetical protein n=1 Tax=unclassified Leptolyngbya TaxID=2650499 RepID=UPI0016819D0C|nr:hypothetical protein [Leptolyngbya sp. FACHB-17]MBD2079484.1 hypothetical protein [Leptolyngbya sp. FACHB-17]